MKNLKFCMKMFAVVAIAMMFGCSDIDQPVESEIDVVSKKLPLLTQEESIALAVQRKGTYFISENEAIEKFQRFLAFNGQKGTKTKSATDGDIRVLSTSLKRNAKTGDVMYYEVVFESEKGTGFSLISADERIQEVLCYSEVGAISDTSFNKSLKFCLELVDFYVENQTKEELDVETLALSANEKILASSDDNNSRLKRVIPPLDPNNPCCGWYLKSYYTITSTDLREKLVPGGWHQDAPFNNLLPYVSGITTSNGRALVGCGMIAVSQVMAYHKKNYTNKIKTSDWPAMIANPAASTLLQGLMLDLFNAMKTSYGTSGTSSNNITAAAFLDSNGFTTNHTFGVPNPASSYSFANVWNALQWGPTLIRGTRSGNVGHMWVIDGAKQVNYQTIEVWEYEHNGNILQIPHTTYHGCHKTVRFDWGWGIPSDNTWFNDGVFLMPSSQNNYNSNVQVFDYIKP